MKKFDKLLSSRYVKDNGEINFKTPAKSRVNRFHFYWKNKRIVKDGSYSGWCELVNDILRTNDVTTHSCFEYSLRFMEKYNFKDYVTSVQVYGSTRIIEIDILVRKNFPYQTIAEIDAIRNEIDQEIGGNPTEKWVTISFTGTRKWMAKDYLLDEEDDEQ